MHWQSLSFAAIVAGPSAVASKIPASELATNIDRLTTLTRIANSVTRDVVFVNNPPKVRQEVIGIVDAITVQATLDEHLLNGNPCGSLTKRSSFALSERGGGGPYTAGQQKNITDSYAILVNVTHSFTAALVEKHHAIVEHQAAHDVAQALNASVVILDRLTDTILNSVPDQAKPLSAQQNTLTKAYKSTIKLYASGQV